MTENSSITFYLTNNAWINNGLVRLAQTLEHNFESKVSVQFKGNSVELKSLDKGKSIHEMISEALHSLAAYGTYNFNGELKILNRELKQSYKPPKGYPETQKDLDGKIEISKEEIDILKKRGVTDTKKERKIWKARNSYLALTSKETYFVSGLKFESTEDYTNLVEIKDGKRICPLCGAPTNKLSTSPLFLNPLSGEHHNNEIEGVSNNIRKKVDPCPRCATLCYFSLFDYHIPFVYISMKETDLVFPNTLNLDILKKISNNLSISGQHIDFKGDTCTSYGTNIKSLPARSKSASMLALMHNIRNEYHREEPTQSITFQKITETEFKEIVDWLFMSKDARFSTIKADEKIYQLLDPVKDPKTESDIHLVPDILCNIRLNKLDEVQIDNFYNSILTLNVEKLAKSLFIINKQYIDNPGSIKIEFRPEGSPVLQLLTDVFIEKIFEVATMLDKQTKDASKDVAQSIGKNFSKDVGMMTKFAYASGPDEFKKALEDASFRLAKSSAAEDGSKYFINANNLESLYSALEKKESFADIKNYFVSFMSVYALQQNYSKKE